MIAKRQQKPGSEAQLEPKAQSAAKEYVGSGKLLGKVAIVTGGDSGIGKAVSIAFAKEGAFLVIPYLVEHEDANTTARSIKEAHSDSILIAGDLKDEQFCQTVTQRTIESFGHIDILVNNAGTQQPQQSILDISTTQLKETFETNVFAYFYMIKAVLPHMKPGAVIINTTSVTAYKGSPQLIDYAATKGAIVSLTRSLALSLAAKQIRVNGVAPGPVWTPLIPSTFDESKLASFGQDVPLGRPGQPDEIAPAYVFLAGDDSSYMTGQILHPNGGSIVNG